MTTERIEVYNGFKPVQRIDKLDLYSAYDIILGTSKQFGYSEVLADFRRDIVYFKKDLFICPICGFQFGAYKHTVEGYKPKKKINRSTAYEYCCIPSLFDESCKILKLYEPLVSTDKIICPNCFHSAPIATNSENYSINYNKHKLTVSTELTSIKDVLDIHWVEGLTITDFPLTESITFNFTKGHVFSVLSANGKTICVRDITNSDFNVTSKLIFAINNNAFLKGSIKRFFRKEWNKSLPYQNNELNFKRFCEMTMYIGYPRTFYSNMPYTYDNKRNIILSDLVYKGTVKSLHRYDNLPKLFLESGLPKTKALKRLLFDNPYLFFYTNEIKKLIEIFNDLNNLLVFLKNGKADELLMFMHTYEHLFEFYSDFAKIKGKNSLLRYLTIHSEKFNNYGTIYLSYGERLRKSEQQKWKLKKGHCIDMIEDSISNYYYDTRFHTPPYHDEDFEFKKMNIDGYTFIPLRTKKDYVYSGEELHNCLGEFDDVEYPVICIKKNGKNLAAIEVDPFDKTIPQALLKDNERMEKNKAVYGAFKKWCKYNGLKDKYT